MAFYNSKPLPGDPYSGHDAITIGWYFEHRADGTWIGPFNDKQTAIDAEHSHYKELYAIPLWANYQS